MRELIPTVLRLLQTLWLLTKHGLAYILVDRRGGTDAGVIHISYAGCPSVVLGVPTRHIHSHVGILSLEDAENCVKLVVEVIKKLDADTVANLTAL